MSKKSRQRTEQAGWGGFITFLLIAAAIGFWIYSKTHQ
jgi:hypothetical protein